MDPIILDLHYLAYDKFCKTWSIEPRVLTDYEILYIVSGNGMITAEEKKYPFEANQFILIPPGVSHSMYSRKLPLILWCIHFSAYIQMTRIPTPHQVEEGNSFIKGLIFPRRDPQLNLQPLSISIPLVFSPENQISYILAEKIRKLMESGIEENVSKIKVLLEGILKSNCKNSEKPAPSLTSQIQEYIERHYAEKISLSQLSQIFYRDPSYISALFRKNTGVTITDYIRGCRINSAKSYLAYTSESVEFIAEKTGFYDSSHFCRTFSWKEKMSPIQYRKYVRGN